MRDTFNHADGETVESLSAESRGWLVDLAMRAVPFADGRNLPPAVVALVERGLVFRWKNAVAITEKGRDVCERVT